MMKQTHFMVIMIIWSLSLSTGWAENCIMDDARWSWSVVTTMIYERNHSMKNNLVDDLYVVRHAKPSHFELLKA